MSAAKSQMFFYAEQKNFLMGKKPLTNQGFYNTGLVKFVADADPDGMLSAAALSGRDDMEISVFGNEDRILLVSRFDNLGKGASGAAIQNMNIALGIPESTGLCI